MSVRIYELSKKIGMENKELIALLKERGHEVKSASSTISDIYADALLEEMKPADNATQTPTGEEPTAEPEVKEAPKLPAGKFVKSADDIKEAAQASKAAPTPPVVKSAPVFKPAAAPTPPATPPATPPSAAAPTPPPIVKSAPKPPSSSAPTPPPLAGKAPVAPPTPPANPAPSSNPADAADSEDGADVKIISLKPPIVVRDFAGELGLKPFKLISELMEMGIFASINQTIEEDIAAKIAESHGYMLEVRHRGEQQETPKAEKAPKPKEEDDSANQEPRPPVVCVLGHVDHGKTTLLDTIRKANVVSGEAGGITQHVGAYQVEQEHDGKKKKITFIDTPGHAAFSKMRERGANVTDIAILVVAADDSFMPQTDEALKFIQKANVALVVAINKMDAKGANIDAVKQDMQQRGIAPEDWGGETLCTPISALKGENIEELLENVLLQAEMMELTANPKCNAEGVIVESQVEVGRGSTATAIIQKGTLKVGDAIVCGTSYCKVRALMTERGERIKSAPPSTPVSILGWNEAPQSGATLVVVKNEREAKRLAEEAIQERKRNAITMEAEAPAPAATLDSLFNAIESQQEKIYRVIIKADVHGSAEALKGCLEEIKSDKVSLEILATEVGPISKNDITMASASHAAVVGFNVKQENGVIAQAKHHNVRIIQHNIIYELIDQVKEGMAELLEPEKVENKLGAAEVRQVFSLAKGYVAGCMITEGKFLRDAFARIHRKGEIVLEGRVSTLKRFKEDVGEVRAGYECGIKLGNSNDYQEGDILECFEIQLVTPDL